MSTLFKDKVILITGGNAVVLVVQRHSLLLKKAPMCHRGKTRKRKHGCHRCNKSERGTSHLRDTDVPKWLI